MTGDDLSSATARGPDGAKSQKVDDRATSEPPTWYDSEQYSQQSNYSESSLSSQSTQASQSQKVRKTGTGGGAWNAPIAHFMMTETSGQTYGFDRKTEEEHYCRLAEEARKWVLGPMPPQDFLDTFLKTEDLQKWGFLGDMPASAGAFQAVPETAKLEQAIYEPLAEAINQGRCPGFTFCITSEGADSSGPLGLTGSCKPDLCCYADEHMGDVKNYVPGKDKPKPKPKEKPKRKRRNKKKNDVGGSGTLGVDLKGGAGGLARDEAGGAGPDPDSSDADTVRQTSPGPAPTHSKSKSDADSTSTPSKQAVPMKYTHMGYAELVIEVKRHHLDDVFCDPKSGDDRTTFHFVTTSENVKVLKKLGQQVAYASEMCKRQHRHFCFTISVCGPFARFLRWDRAGVIVSERFSVRTQPDLLCDFLWRFACASHAQRGYDLTVEPATEDQAKLFVSAVEAHVRTQGGPTEQPKYEAAVKEHYQEKSVTVLHLLGSNAGETLAVGPYLLVSRPIVVPLSVAGRGTRTYWAVSPDTKDVWLLKDTWRYDASGEPNASEREGDVLRAVGQVTEHVPPVAHHEDVPRAVVTRNPDGSSRPEETDSLWIEHTFGVVQTTLTQDFLDPEKFSWVCRANHTLNQLKRFITKRTHYRLVLGAAGYPLLRFKDSKELLHATYDAFGALKAAFEMKKRLHRDVTPGNIILYNDPKQTGLHMPNSTELRTGPRKGYLIDWELSRECELASSKSRSFVTSVRESCAVSATWQFLSASIAMYVRQRDGKPPRRHTICDDIESMIYVVLYCALLWLPFKEPNPISVQNVLKMFDWWTTWQDGAIRGGVLKHNNLSEDQIFTKSLRWTVPTLQKWLSNALKQIKPDTGTSTSKGRTMEQHFHVWWGKFLAKHQGAEHHAMRFDNTTVSVLETVFKSRSPAVMEGVAHQSTVTAQESRHSPTKRFWKEDGLPSPDEAGPSLKRPRLGWSNAGPSHGAHLLPTSWRTSDEGTADTIQAASSWNSSRAPSVFREIMETGGGAEAGLGDYEFESDYESEADEESADDDEGDEDEAPMEVEGSASKGKTRARGVKGWGE